MTGKDSQWIRERLPHRYPLLLVDRVIEFEHGQRIVAIKNVTINEEFFQGHFPSFPVMPGVLILEAMAQAGGLMVLPEDDSVNGLNFFLAGIENAKFRRPVVPGDQLRIEVTIRRVRGAFRKLAGRVEVDGHLAAEAEFTLAGAEA